MHRTGDHLSDIHEQCRINKKHKDLQFLRGLAVDQEPQI